MFIQNMSKREKLLLAISIMMATGALSYAFVMEPLTARWKNVNDQISSRAIVLRKNRHLLNNFEALEREYSKYQDLIKAGKSEEEEFAATLAAIEEISKMSACRIINVKSRASRPLGRYREILLEVTAEGGVTELTQFILLTEASKERLRITHFTILTVPNQSSLKAIFFISKLVLS